MSKHSTARMEPDRLLTSGKVGSLLQIHPTSVVKWINEGMLPAFKTLGQHRRIQVRELRAFLRRHGMWVPPQLDAENLRVLLLDNDEQLRASLKRSMKAYQEKVDFVTVADGIEALLKVGCEKPDAVVIDTQVPGMDGFEVLRRIKGIPQLAVIEVLLLAPRPTQEMARRARELGAKALLSKPPGARELYEALIAEAEAPSRSRTRRKATA